jgi:hypothetical protein
MTRFKTIRLLLPAIALIAAFASTGFRQGPADKPAGAPLTQELKHQTLEALVKLLHERYVFPDVGDKAGDALKQHEAAHDYDALTDGRAFTLKVNQDLRDVCHDAHLHLGYSVDTLPVRGPRGEPSKEDLAREKAQSRRDNGAYQRVERLDGNIGLIKITAFPDAKDVLRPAKAAMEFVANTDALIFDMRQNQGGSPESVQIICSYLFGDKPVHLNSIYERDSGKTEEFWTLAKVDGPRYLGREVYILTSPRCGSAGEEFCYNLQTQKRATLIGDRTWGGANPGGFNRLNDHFNAFIPTGRAINPITNKNWEGTGVIPDIKVDPKDALKFAHRLAVENLLKKATSDDDKQRLNEVLKEIDQIYAGG